MTTETGTDYLGMINRIRGNWSPCCRKYCMARVTQIGRINMVCTLTTGRHTIVTGNTVINKAGVINSRYLQPVRCVMAIITFQCGLKMCWSFALRYYVIVTTAASTYNLTMVNSTWCYWRPGRWARLMTGITGIC